MDASAATPGFDFSAGAPCLDLVNTLGGRARGVPKDELRGYPDLVEWARQGGLIDGATAARLGRLAERRPAAAARVLEQGRELREALFRLFAAMAADQAPAGGDVATLDRALGRALARLRLVPAGAPEPGPWGWRWDGDRPDEEPALGRPLWPVARSAAEILTSGDLALVRECASAACRWLFLDRSRNRSRRWCSMETCGNRSKARRHYRRHRALAG